MGNATCSPAADGRVRRSERSREAIVHALIGLVGEGALRPTAQQVAERAGVGIRTVFRHDSDMDTLYTEMGGRSAVLPSQRAALVREPRADLLRCLPELAGAPLKLAEALAVAASFETWDRLRTDQRLGRRRALAAMERTALALARELE